MVVVTLAKVVFYSVAFVVYSGYGSPHVVFVICLVFVLEAVPVFFVLVWL